MKNVITRSVGFEADVEVDIYEITTLPKDVFVMCSDGLSGPLDDATILKSINATIGAGKSTQEAADFLIHEANRLGGDDNITAIVVQTQAKGA